MYLCVLLQLSIYLVSYIKNNSSKRVTDTQDIHLY